MNRQEVNDFLSTISHEFEGLGKKLANRGMLADEWGKALMPIDVHLANRALRRWVWKFNTEPTLDRFMQIVEDIQEELLSSHRPNSDTAPAANQIFKAVESAAEKARTPNDKLWAQLHVKLMYKIVGKPQPERDQIMLAHSRLWSEQYPQFEQDCRLAAASLDIDHDSPVPF